MKKVSIIITNYNKTEYIEETILSALSQTYKNCEIIVIDDYSSTEEVEKLRGIEQKYKRKDIKFIYNDKNIGVVGTRNKAIKISSGEYILPLDGDDIIDSEYVKLGVEQLDSNPNLGIVYCDAHFIGEKKGSWDLPKYNPDLICIENVIFSAALFRKNDFISVGGYNNIFNKGHEDWDLWLSIIELGREVYKIPLDLFAYRILKKNSRSLSANRLLHETTYKIMNEHPYLFTRSREVHKRVFCFPDEEELQKQVARYRKKTIKYKRLTLSVFLLSLFLLCIILNGYDDYFNLFRIK